MKSYRSFIAIFAGLFGLAAISVDAATASKPFKVAWTPYPSWQVLPASTYKIAGDQSFLDQRSAEAGAKVEIVKFKEYVVSITALVAGDVDACTMTLQEALSFPVDSGVPVTVVLINDYSNGNDAIFGPKGSTLADLAKNPVLLEEFSVSQYLVYRAAQKNGVDFKSIKVLNTAGDEVPKVFLTSKTKPFVTTWNPHVVRIEESGQASTLFTSKEIPGEIIDAIVVRTDRIAGQEAAIQALVNAYFDTLNHWKRGSDKRTTRAIAATADLKSTAEVDLFSKTVASTYFYWTPEEALAALEDSKLPVTVAKVRDALIQFGAFKGQNPENYKLTFDSSWVKSAASRKMVPSAAAKDK